jgi:hypothetical protein
MLIQTGVGDANADEGAATRAGRDKQGEVTERIQEVVRARGRSRHRALEPPWKAGSARCRFSGARNPLVPTTRRRATDAHLVMEVFPRLPPERHTWHRPSLRNEKTGDRNFDFPTGARISRR